MRHDMLTTVVTVLALLVTAPAQAQSASSGYGIQRSDELADPTLRAWRKKMVAGGRMTFNQLRSLADAYDGLAAFKVAQRLQESGDEALLDDVLHYYAIAVYTGRAFAVPQVVRLVDSGKVQFTPTLAKSVEDALLVQSIKGMPAASSALARMYLVGKPFGAKPEEGLALLERVAAEGDGDAAVELGMIYLSGRSGIPADTAKARAALKLGVQSEDLSASTMAANLLRGMPPTAPPRRPADIMTAQGIEE